MLIAKLLQDKVTELSKSTIVDDLVVKSRLEEVHGKHAELWTLCIERSLEAIIVNSFVYKTSHTIRNDPEHFLAPNPVPKELFLNSFFASQTLSSRVFQLFYITFFSTSL